MGEKVGVGIIGLGGVGQKLRSTFENHKSTRVVAVCDSDENRMKQASGSQSSDAACYLDYRDLIKDDRVSLIYVAAPPKWHHPIVMEAARAKKHLLCEKPLATTVEEALEMTKVVQQSGIVHAMNFPTYYRPCYRAFAQRIADGSLGELSRLTVKAHFPVWPRDWQQNPWINTREQGGFIREVLPHFIHLIQKQFGPLQLESSMIDFPENEGTSERGLAARLTLRNGLIVDFDGLTEAGGEEEVVYSVYGNKGTLRLRNWAFLDVTVNGGRFTPIPLESYDHLSLMVTEVIYALTGNPADIVTFEEGLQVQHVLEAILLTNGAQR